MREGGFSGTAETEDLKRRVDGLHDRPVVAEASLPSPAVQTILARQSLLMSALLHLTGMVEDLLLASGKLWKPVFPHLNDGLGDESSLPRAPAGPYPEAREALPASATRSETEQDPDG